MKNKSKKVKKQSKPQEVTVPQPRVISRESLREDIPVNFERVLADIERVRTAGMEQAFELSGIPVSIKSQGGQREIYVPNGEMVGSKFKLFSDARFRFEVAKRQ